MTDSINIVQKLAELQQQVKCPKSQFNSFGKYHYRNCEDILEGLKPHLGDFVVILEDFVIVEGDRFYVKATATLYSPDGQSISASAYAREPNVKKGMDESQITGSASSYARKYALSGLLLLDDNKDADLQEVDVDEQIAACKTLNELVDFHKTLSDKDRTKYKDKFSDRREYLQGVESNG